MFLVLVNGPEAGGGGLHRHPAQACLAQRAEELGEAGGNTAHHVAAVADLWQQEGQLQKGLLCELHFATVRAGQLVRDVLRDLKNIFIYK